MQILVQTYGAREQAGPSKAKEVVEPSKAKEEAEPSEAREVTTSEPWVPDPGP